MYTFVNLIQWGYILKIQLHMKKLILILGILPLMAEMFISCEKEVIKEVEVYIEYDEFTFTATTDQTEGGELIVFTDPNYPNEDRFELFFETWEYKNDIKVNQFDFFALTYGTSISLIVEDVKLGSSISIEDDYGDFFSYLELSYNGKKSQRDIDQLIKRYKEELKRRAE